MRILVTGGYGFLGESVCKSLESRNHEVQRFHSPRNRSFGGFDLLCPESTFGIIGSSDPDAVIHLAAVVGGIGANKKEPGRFAFENLMMGLNVIEACRHFKIRKMVLAGTICMYPKFAPVPFKEENLWDGYPEETNAPYGIAKKALMVTAQGYRLQYNCNFVTLMPVNLYGPRDNFDLETSHVIPAMIRKFHEAKKLNLETVTLWGDGTPTREFLFVDDAADAFALAVEKYDSSVPINIGTGKEISMFDLSSMIKQIVGYEGAIIWDKSKPNGQPRRCLDVSRAEKALGWKARTDLKTGLIKTYYWFKENQEESRNA